MDLTRHDVAESQSEPDGWSACCKAMKAYDEDMIARWKDEIDTLLVFAGLLSGVLTAFLIESYKLLSVDFAQLSTELLIHILAKLDQSAVNVTTEPMLANFAAYTPSTSSVRVNILWFSGLVFTLLASLLAIAVKQWLREYLVWVSLPPSRDTVRLRQFCFDGLGNWHMEDIVALLPVLLQISVILFLCGMVDLLWTLHRVVAGVITAFVGSFLFVALTSAILPMVVAGCPYKSPLAWILLKTKLAVLWPLVRLLRMGSYVLE
ncbi:hypothetical protein PUNSTDRAFT_63907, partial [Punctularia strigosozonata HHB-11173 SS5]|uniref:uncharacterized protein n=1 Tax=Punctularia strigosozonata (strain HHB-11173) TaxID=741275 RepID=UPI0004418137